VRLKESIMSTSRPERCNGMGGPRTSEWRSPAPDLGNVGQAQ
jgi:hypothetical protein